MQTAWFHSTTQWQMFQKTSVAILVPLRSQRDTNITQAAHAQYKSCAILKWRWFLGVADHQMTSLLACYQPLQILIWANECKIFVGLSVPTNSLTTFDLHN